jgi:hypothetical protein
MDVFEFGSKPARFGIRQARWLGNMVRRSVSNETGLDNIVATWREPIRHEIAQHTDDARVKGDMQRLSELYDVQRCMDLFAPHDAKTFAERVATEHLSPDPHDIVLLLYRYRHENHGEA